MDAPRRNWATERSDPSSAAGQHPLRGQRLRGATSIITAGALLWGARACDGVRHPRHAVRWVGADGRRRAGAAAVTLALAAIVVVAAMLPGLAVGGDPGGAPGQALATWRLVADLGRPGHARALPKATAAPAPPPPSVATASPLQSHEVFAFAPYWTLSSSSGFAVSQLSTVAYFSVDVNGDGSVQTSGAGWNGYQSQALVDLINRAHSAGDRVVLTASDLDQASLDKLTSDPGAPARLANTLLSLVEAKQLDGVNLDLEGNGRADQQGLTRLVAEVSRVFHQANAHYQVTMDTYASSAGDPNGFYDIPALAPYVDGFFVMAYELNLRAAQSSHSPITSAQFSDEQAAEQYAAVVPASKVILGTPFYGEEYATTDGTLAATATSGATPIGYAQIVAAKHPVYWDAVTDTAWTSFEVGQQWHEIFFDDPTSLYMVASLAQWFGLGGVGIWALGMDGSSDPAMVSAIAGGAPAQKDTLAGPTSTSPSASPSTTTTAPPTSTTTTAPPSATPGASPSTPTTSPATPTPTPTTTTTAPQYAYSGTFVPTGSTAGQPVQLHAAAVPVAPAGVAPYTHKPVGTITGFTTNDPALACLSSEPSTKPLTVYVFTAPHPHQYFLLTTKLGGYCARAVLAFPLTG